MMQNKQRGFTITELMLAMAFLTFMLLFIVSATVQLLRTYNKGLTIKSISQSSRTILETIGRDVSRSKQVTVVAGQYRLCTDQVSYIWNPPIDSLKNRYSNNQVINFARFETGDLCTRTNGAYRQPLQTDGTELLDKSAAVIGLNATKVNDISQLYSIALKIGTSDPNGYDIDACKSDSEGDFCATADFNTVVYSRYGS